MRTGRSVFGAMHGSGALSGQWVDPLNDLVRSSIMDFDRSRLSELAVRTIRLANAAGRVSGIRSGTPLFPETPAR